MIDSSSLRAVGNSLLGTKLYTPQWRSSMVSRPRLVERLDRGVQRRLTLISAPAGFGKTTLLAEWLADASAHKLSTAWVSLDASDNDPTLFWSYFITALKFLHTGIGERTLALLYASQAPPITAILSTLINELSAIEDDFALVLDDYHIIENEGIHSSLTFLIDHLPPKMHLVIASRIDLPFPTARLRASGELTELRAADLQFQAGEVTTFLNHCMGLNLSESDVTTLGQSTEGWIAGLQLAALSMQGRNDVHQFLNSFGGDDRYIFDFLVEEVLRHQPGHVRQFLLASSILSRLCGSLCDAVTEQDRSKKTLEALEQGNLFVIPLDDKRNWYRYHHLFGDMLREILVREHAELVAVLHGRASMWYEKHSLLSDAIHHAFEAGDIERVAYLVEVVADDMYSTGQSTTLYDWLNKLPDNVLPKRPVLCFWRGWSFLDRGEIDASRKYFQMAENGFEEAGDIVFVDEKQWHKLPGRLATALATSARAFGDAAGTVKYATRALKLLPEEDYLWRGGTTVILGLTSWANGDLPLAYKSIADGFDIVSKTGEPLYQIAGGYLMADIRVAQGRLNDALSLYKRFLRLASKQAGPVIQGTADLHLCMSEIVLEQGKQAAALQHFAAGKNLGAHASNIEFRDRWLSTEARFKEVQGQYDKAQELLDEAEQHYMLGPVPYARPYAARKVRIWIRQGRLSEALAWAQSKGLSVDADPGYLQEYEYITLARLYIAQFQLNQVPYDLDKAKRLLASLQEAGEAGERVGSLIEILILHAIVCQLNGDTINAHVKLNRALNLAAPEEYIQIFVDEGEVLQSLLKKSVAEGIGGDFTRKLYTTILKSVSAIDRMHRGGDVLIEPLSNREIEVLRHIVAGMKNQEIADHLYISLATVKRHISNVYGKLEVKRRTEAIARARKLNLL